MRIANDYKPELEKDKVENVKQKRQEFQSVLHSRVKPNENHILFEFDVKDRELRLAKYHPQSFDIHWSEAVNKYLNRKNIYGQLKSVPQVTKAKVIKKQNCIYVTALNRDSALKILKRDFGIAG